MHGRELNGFSACMVLVYYGHLWDYDKLLLYS